MMDDAVRAKDITTPSLHCTALHTGMRLMSSMGIKIPQNVKNTTDSKVT